MAVEFTIAVNTAVQVAAVGEQIVIQAAMAQQVILYLGSTDNVIVAANAVK